MKIKKITGILLVMMLLTAVFTVAVNASDPPPTVEPTEVVQIFGSVDVRGSVGNTINADIKITAQGGNGFVGLNPSSVKGWFAETHTEVTNPITNFLNPDFTAEIISVEPGMGQAIGMFTIRIKGTVKPEPATPPTPPVIGGHKLNFRIPANVVASGTGSPTETPKAIKFLSDDDVFTILKTTKVVFPRYTNSTNNGTLTASGIDYELNRQVEVKNGTGTIDGISTSVAYVTEGTELTFTAAPAAGYGVGPAHTGGTGDGWTVTNGTVITTGGAADNILVRKIKIDTAADAEVKVNFIEIYTAYRIYEVDVGGYKVQQTRVNNDDVTKITKTGVTEDIDAIEMTFGETPFVINAGSLADNKNIAIVTNWQHIGTGTPHYPINEASGKFYLPPGAIDPTDSTYVPDSDNSAPYDFLIQSSPAGVVKTEVVPQNITGAYKGVLDRHKIADTAYASGDLIITPQGAGTATITITVKRKTDSSYTYPHRLADAVIKFDVTVKAADTDVSYDDGIITAVTDNVYGERVQITIDPSKETAYTTNLKPSAANSDRVTVAGRSYNGTSWSAVNPPIIHDSVKPTDISGLLNTRGTSFKLAENVSGGKPAAGAAIWEIGEITARQSNPKLKVYYGNVDADKPEDRDTDTWTVTGYDFGEIGDPDYPSDKLFFASSKDGKNPDTGEPTLSGPANNANSAFGFMIFNPEEPPKVKDLPVSTGKVTRSAYYFKLAADVKMLSDDTDSFDPAEDVDRAVISPASKTVRLQVSSKLKPANIKVDYKKERVLLKNGMAYKDDNDDKYVDKALSKAGIQFRDTTGNATGSVIFSSTVAGQSEDLTYWTAANGKKPQSEPRTVKVYDYSTWTGADESAVKSGFNEDKRTYRLPKGYEARPLGSTSKWRTSVGKVTSEKEFEVRRRGNARFDAKNINTWLRAGTNTASVSKKLTIEFGEYNDGKRVRNAIEKITISNMP